MIALIILTYNNVECLGECLASISKHNSERVVTIVVDNNSTPDNRRALESMLQSFFGGSLQVMPQGCSHVDAESAAFLVLCGSNQGYARGNNAGLEVAYALPMVDKVAIMNDDVIFVDNVLGRLSSWLDDNPAYAFVSPLLLRPGMEQVDGNCARREETAGQIVQHNFLKYYWQWRGSKRYYWKNSLLEGIKPSQVPDVVDADLVSGAFFMAKKDLMQSIGGFDPNTFLYYEENILHKKLQRAGLRSCVLGKLWMVHKGANTIGRQGWSLAKMKANTASQRYFVNAYSGAGPFMRALHWCSLKFYLFSYYVQQKLAPGFLSKTKRTDNKG